MSTFSFVRCPTCGTNLYVEGVEGFVQCFMCKTTFGWRCTRRKDSNETRANRGRVLLNTYESIRDDRGQHTAKAVVTSMLCDLYHYCHRNGMDFPTLAHNAQVIAYQEAQHEEV